MSEVSLLPKQVEFIQAVMDKDINEILFLGGVGSGKTHIGCLALIMICFMYPNVNGIMASLTYKSLIRTNVPYILSMLETIYGMKEGVHFRYKKGDQVFEFANGSKIWMATQENAVSHFKSINCGVCLLDEVGAWSEEAFDLVFGRMREAPMKMLFITSPEGFNHIYDHFVKNYDEDKQKVIIATTYDNPTLPDGYTERMKRRYSTKKFKQECLAEFVDLYDGQCLPSFDRDKHVLHGKQYKQRPKVLPNNTAIWLDWNRTPFCAGLAYHNKELDRIELFDEIRLEGANTKSMGLEIQRRYPHDWDRLIIRADHTNANQQTSTITSETNYSVLEDMGFATEFVLNPGVRSSIDNVDRLLEQGKFKTWEHCIHSIADQSQCVFNAEGTGIDKLKNKNISHLFDIIRYLCNYFKTPRQDKQSKYTKPFYI